MRYFVTSSFAILTGSFGLLLIGCNQSPSTPTPPTTSTTPVAVERTEVAEPIGSEAYPVPDGTAVEIMKFMDRMVMEPPSGDTENLQTQDLMNRMVSRVAAAEQILAGDESDEYGAFAARLKLESLRVLANIGYEGGKKKFEDYAEELAGHTDDAYSRSGRFGKFQGQIDELMASPDGAGGDEIVPSLSKLLEKETRDRDLFEISREASRYLALAGFATESCEAAAAISDAFRGHEDQEIAQMAVELESEGKVAQLNSALNDFMTAAEPDGARLKSIVDEVIETKPGAAVLGGIMNASLQIENSGFPDVSAHIYERLAEPIIALKENAPAALEEREMVSVIQSGLERANRRLSMIGKEIEITGLDAEGNEFDWSQYADKVVLVDFWASWCEPCAEELINIRENYERYHEKGFEVVGVNVDKDLDQAKAFLDKQKVPWVTVFSDSDSLGIEANPNAKRYGVETIPFIALVGKDGKVTAIHARGHLLSEALAIELGAPSDEILLDLDFDDESEDSDAEVETDVQGKEAPDDGSTATEQTSLTARSASAIAKFGLSIRKTVQHEPVLLALAMPQESSDENVEQSASNLTDEEANQNPYAPDAEMSTKELVNFLLDMQDKTSSIQFRDGFRDGIVIASDRILADANSKRRFREIAAEAKLDYLHRDACLGDEKADKLILDATKTLAGEESKKIAAMLEFFAQERVAIASSKTKKFDDKTYRQLFGYLKESQQSEKSALSKRHLRMASSMVEILNLMEDDDQREKEFKALSKVLVASDDKQLKRYGRRIGPRDASPAVDFIGKPLEMVGTTVDGEAFTQAEVKGKVVLVDFWATWCGPCRAAMPELQKLYEKYQPQGLEVIGVSLDQDLDALRDYLKDNNLPWIHLAGDETSKIADKYGVRGIPSMLLVDREGKVLAQGHPSDKSFKAKLTDQFK